MQYITNAHRYRIVKDPVTVDESPISSSHVAAEFCRELYTDDIGVFESFWVVFLRHSNTPIGVAKISMGGLTSTIADIRIICKYAIESLSTKVILCHNHPSGNLKPSEADKKLTARLVEALKVFDIQVVDHVILSERSYFSFADDCLI
jgi:DNA repair protein RadC